VLLIDPFVRGDTLFGRVDLESAGADQKVGFPLDQVSTLERQRVHGLRTAALTTGIIVGLVLVGVYRGGLE
jgi:hypothetical protein